MNIQEDESNHALLFQIKDIEGQNQIVNMKYIYVMITVNKLISNLSDREL